MLPSAVCTAALCATAAWRFMPHLPLLMLLVLLVRCGVLSIGSVHSVKPVEGAKFPASLTTLSFGASFNQPVEDAEFPEGLEGLYFGDGDKVCTAK